MREKKISCTNKTTLADVCSLGDATQGRKQIWQSKRDLITVKGERKPDCHSSQCTEGKCGTLPENTQDTGYKPEKQSTEKSYPFPF